MKTFSLGFAGVPAILALVLALSFVSVSSTLGQSETGGKVLSFVCEDLPPRATVTVEAYNDDDLNLEIANAFTGELVKRGYRVGAGQQFRIMMDSRVDLDPVDKRGPTLGSLKGNNRRVELNLNIWSNRDDSLLAGQRKGAARNPPRLIVTATLRDQKTDKVLWQGEASDDLGSRRPVKVGKALMPDLAEAFRCSLDPDRTPSSTE